MRTPRVFWIAEREAYECFSPRFCWFLASFIFEMDANSLTLGAVLCQVQGSRKHVKHMPVGDWRVQKEITEITATWSESCSLSNGLSGKCKKYLLGCKFTVQTDNHPLLHLLGDEEEFDGCISICNLINWATALVPEIVSAGLKCCQVRQAHVMATEQDSHLRDSQDNTSTLAGYAKYELQQFMQFWAQKKKLTHHQRKGLAKPLTSLLWQWPQVRKTEGLLYQVINDGHLREYRFVYRKLFWRVYNRDWSARRIC